jgi:hydrogenase nickel incorporation protein HypB
MCTECGCGLPDKNLNHGHHHHDVPETTNKKEIAVFKKILEKNDHQAQHNREHFDKYGILSVNLMSSPGAGKTTLLEKTIEALKDRYKIGVIEGDLETERDAERVRNKGAVAYQITTGQTCHLDAFMVHKGLHHLPLEELDIVFVENVGNLVCPASFDVGTHLNVVLLSVPEGDDKPAKYPVMFKKADLLIITKADLLPYFDFDVERCIKEFKELNPEAEVIVLSTKTGEGLDKWINWLITKKEEISELPPTEVKGFPLQRGR